MTRLLFAWLVSDARLRGEGFRDGISEPVAAHSKSYRATLLIGKPRMMSDIHYLGLE